MLTPADLLEVVVVKVHSAFRDKITLFRYGLVNKFFLDEIKNV